MKVSQLYAGMLLIPRPGFAWAEIPWNSADGSRSANYLVVVPNDSKPKECDILRDEPVLYLGTNLHSMSNVTPGSQVVLAWGKKMTVDPHSWRNINNGSQHCTK